MLLLLVPGLRMGASPIVVESGGGDGSIGPWWARGYAHKLNEEREQSLVAYYAVGASAELQAVDVCARADLVIVSMAGSAVGDAIGSGQEASLPIIVQQSSGLSEATKDGKQARWVMNVFDIEQQIRRRQEDYELLGVS